MFKPVTEKLRGLKRLTYPLGRLCLVVGKFKESLYNHKHAFYFREVKHWEAYLLVNLIIMWDCSRPNHLFSQNALQVIDGTS